MNITKQKGLITELQCQLAFSNLGFTVCMPICEDSRYDYIVDINGKLIRVQCKTSSVLENEKGIEFSTRSCSPNTKTTVTKYYTKDDIDYFYTFYNGQSYLIPIEDTSNSSKKLRFWTNNGQQQKISWAEDYELEKILKRDFENIDFQYNEIHYQTQSSKKFICPECGGPAYKENTLCLTCTGKKNRKVERPSREELKELIRKLPFTQIGEKFNVSDNAVRKWCDTENLPRTKTDINKYSDEEWKEV